MSPKYVKSKTAGGMLGVEVRTLIIASWKLIATITLLILTYLGVILRDRANQDMGTPRPYCSMTFCQWYKDVDERIIKLRDVSQQLPLFPEISLLEFRSLKIPDSLHNLATNLIVGAKHSGSKYQIITNNLYARMLRPLQKWEAPLFFYVGGR